MAYICQTWGASLQYIVLLPLTHLLVYEAEELALSPPGDGGGGRGARARAAQQGLPPRRDGPHLPAQAHTPGTDCREIEVSLLDTLLYILQIVIKRLNMAPLTKLSDVVHYKMYINSIKYLEIVLVLNCQFMMFQMVT